MADRLPIETWRRKAELCDRMAEALLQEITDSHAVDEVHGEDCLPEWGCRASHQVLAEYDRLCGDEEAHCWEEGPRDGERDIGTTCMRADGHWGPHEFVADDEILVTFPPKEAQP